MGKTDEVEKTLSPYTKNKVLATVFMVLGVFGILVIIHRLSYYVYEYDAKFSPVDYGKFNILSFFTVQSNIFVSVYLILLSSAMLGAKKLEKIVFNPVLGAFLTTYIFLTGLIYCCGIPMGFTPPFKWDTSGHSMSSFIQVFHHMIIPPLMVVLWFFPFSNEKIKIKKVWFVAIYPLVYSLFSIIRGAVGGMKFYPYPFYRAEFIWSLFMGEKAVNLVGANFLMLPVLVVGMLLFVGVGMLFALVRNKQIDAVFSKNAKNAEEIETQ